MGGAVAGILGQTLFGRPTGAGQVGRSSAGGAVPGKGSDQVSHLSTLLSIRIQITTYHDLYGANAEGVGRLGMSGGGEGKDEVNIQCPLVVGLRFTQSLLLLSSFTLSS